MIKQSQGSLIMGVTFSLLLSCPTSYYPVLGFTPKLSLPEQQRPITRSPEFRTKDVRTCNQVYDSGEPASKFTIMLDGYFVFPFRQQGQRSLFMISELNTEPAHSSVNA